MGREKAACWGGAMSRAKRGAWIRRRCCSSAVSELGSRRFEFEAVLHCCPLAGACTEIETGYPQSDALSDHGLHPDIDRRLRPFPCGRRQQRRHLDQHEDPRHVAFKDAIKDLHCEELPAVSPAQHHPRPMPNAQCPMPRASHSLTGPSSVPFLATWH